jgi:hypothetical protein
LNTAPDSQNEIHGDEIARKYGFKGGLVPGVTISAYIVQPAVEAWGKVWLDRGAADVRVVSPLYDGEQFEVSILDQSESAYTAELRRPDGTVSATADVSLPNQSPQPPIRTMAPLADKHYVGPEASKDTFAKLKREGCLAFRYRWGGKQLQQSYLQDETFIPSLLRTDGEGYANMSFLLGCSNWILASNAHMNPWVHLETHSQNFRAVPAETHVIAEMRVADFYAKKGHEFIDAEVTLFDEADDSCLATIDLRAIYKLRGL